ncbi:MAG: 50S ribosomal protein L3 [Smithellaceae bacterium]|nr:50S ribosomal protein L3 [Smithellaceae bacterium]
MGKGIIGRKLGMTQVFSEEGDSVPVTVIEVEPSVVVQKKTTETDGYEAIQLGYGRIKQQRVTKPLQGHFKKADKGLFRYLREIRTDTADYELGQELTADIFSIGDIVDVIGTSRGKGFAGVIKRHGFGGGRATHGSMFHRAPGSIGASAYPSRVFKGTRLPGHMGDARSTVQNLMVVGVRSDLNLILVKGAVPGGKNGVLLIREALKKS